MTAVRECLGLGCHAIDEHPSRLCDACIAERARAERTAQGLDPTITDPTVIDQVATVVRPSATENAA